MPKNHFFFTFISFQSQKKKKMSNEKAYYICHQTLMFGRPENQKINSWKQKIQIQNTASSVHFLSNQKEITFTTKFDLW